MNTTPHSSEPTPPTIEGRLEKLLATEGCTKQMRSTSMRKQRAFVKRVSEALESEERDVLGALCKHLAQKGKVQSALSYIEMYVDAGDISPQTLAHAFRSIMTSTYEKNRIDDPENPKLATPPKGLFRIMQKLEKNYTQDIDGTISLIQGKVSQVFSGDMDKAIDQYRLALEKKHPQACYLLATTLVEKDLYEEGLQIFLRGWTEFHDLDCLTEYIRLSFFLGNEHEATKHYEILKGLKEDTAHILEYIPQWHLPERLPLFLDYLRGHHAHGSSHHLSPDIYRYAIYWIRSRLIELKEEQESVTETMRELEEKGLNMTEINSKKRAVILDILGTMEIGAIYLLDTTITVQYLENILALIQGDILGRELLTEHILASESYARKWVEGRGMQVMDMDDMEVDMETGKISRMDIEEVPDGTTSMLVSPDDFPEQSTDDGTESIIDDMMGVLDMVLYHSMVYHDDDISELYGEITGTIVNDPGAFHIDKVHEDALIEKNIFDGMPKRVRDWYEKLEQTVDDIHSPFVRKKIQGAHRSGGTVNIAGTKDILLFLILDGFLSDIEEEKIDAYIEALADIDLTYTEGLNLATLCMHFGNYGLAFVLLCDGMADWSNTETLVLAIHLINKITSGADEASDEMIKQMETSIREQNHEIEDFEEFILSSINWQFSENEHPEDEGLLYELSGLSALLYGDKKRAIEDLTKAYDLGNTSALLDMAMLYGWDEDYESSYRFMKQAYDPENPEYAIEVPKLADLAIATGRRHEVPEYLRVMQANNVEGTSWTRFYFGITGNRAEVIEAIRSLGIYGRNIPEDFDSAIISTTEDRMTTIRDYQGATSYEQLSCQRGLALLESEGQSQAISYWQMLEKLVIEENFEALSEHLTELIDTYTRESLEIKMNEKNIAYESARVGLASEALAFRRQRGKDKDFIFLFDLMYRVCSAFPEHDRLMKYWQQEIQGSMTPEQSFELGYDLGRFGEKATLQ